MSFFVFEFERFDSLDLRRRLSRRLRSKSTRKEYCCSGETRDFLFLCRLETRILRQVKVSHRTLSNTRIWTNLLKVPSFSMAPPIMSELTSCLVNVWPSALTV